MGQNVVRGNELSQRGRAVMWVGMQFGVASQTSAYTLKLLYCFLTLNSYRWKRTSKP